jgi:threonine/homoserine/homoserine lactone efflux protein
MPSLDTLLVFAALSLGLALTPGPNMLYLVSRSLAQGTRAGMVSLIGCQAGSLLIILLAAAGITAALLAIPYAWDALRLGGAAYLAFLAWQCVRPGAAPIFAPRPMPREPAARLFGLGLATAALSAARWGCWRRSSRRRGSGDGRQPRRAARLPTCSPPHPPGA